MDNTTLNTIRQHIIESEGRSPNPYLDIKGNVTIGPGFHIEAEEEFLSLPLLNPKTGKPATEADKRAEYANMKRLRDRQDRAPERFNRKADKYKAETTLRMPEAEQNKLVDQEIATRVGQIERVVGADAWDKLTDGQKAAVVDVHYANGSLKGFSALKEAIKSGDARAMARESTFYTDKEKGKRNMDRLTRNWARFTGENINTAQMRLEEQLIQRAAQSPDPEPDNGDQSGINDPTSSSADDDSDAGASKGKKDSYSPEIRSFLDDLKKPVDPVSEIMLKDHKDWTEDEVNLVQKSDAYQRPSSPHRDEAFREVRGWYDHHYGKNPVRTDDTGKTVQPVFTTVPVKEPVPARGRDGEPVIDGVLGAGAKIADLAGKRGLSTAIKGAQIGLNLLHKIQSDGSKKNISLKPDGLFGPKTKRSLNESIAALGKPKVEDAVALGSFRNLMENKKGASKGNLGEIAHDSFSNLFQKPSPYNPADRSPKPWGRVLQDTINDTGHNTFGKDSFRPLKTDGWIGPKTSRAFDRVFLPTGSGTFMKSLASNMGFF